MIGVAVVGTGFGEKVQIPAFRDCPQTQVVAVYHRDLERAKVIASAHNIPHACDRLEDIVSLPDVVGVSIATPPFLHYEMAKTVLQAGKHLLLEKPVTLDAAEARELYRLATAKNLIAAVDFEFRFVPAWRRFAELLSEGYVGHKRLIKIDWLVSSRTDPSRPWNWYAQKELGGGALGAIGSHAFDYIKWLFGDIKRLSARLSTSIPARVFPETGEMRPVDADDTCTMMLELADRIPCQVTLSSVTYQGRGHWIEVYGDRGTLILGSDNQKDYIHGFRLWGAAAGKPLAEIEIPNRLIFPRDYADGRIAPLIAVIDRWVQCIESGETIRATAQANANAPSLLEGVYSQLLMDLTHQSHESNCWVDVPDLADFIAS